MTAAFKTVAGGIRLRVRVTPGGGTDRIDGYLARDDGSVVLSVRVRAAPEKGRANAAVAALIARHLGVPKSAVELVSGETARLKTLHVRGDPAALAARLPPPG